MTPKEINSLRQWIAVQSPQQSTAYYELDFILGGLSIFIGSNAVLISLPSPFSEDGFNKLLEKVNRFGKGFNIDSTEPTVNISVFNQTSKTIIEFLTSLYDFNLITILDKLYEEGVVEGLEISSTDKSCYITVLNKSIQCTSNSISIPEPEICTLPSTINYYRVPLKGFSLGHNCWVCQRSFFTEADVINILLFISKYYESEPEEFINPFINLLRKYKPFYNLHIVRSYFSYSIYLDSISKRKVFTFSPWPTSLKISLATVYDNGTTSLTKEVNYKLRQKNSEEDALFIYQNFEHFL